MYSVTLPKSVSDEVSEGTSEVVVVRTLSTTMMITTGRSYALLRGYLRLNMILSRVRLVSLRYAKVQC